MTMAAAKIPCPVDRAEGLCLGVPYNTELVSINGVCIHFWLGTLRVTAELLRKLRSHASHQRDIVRATYSSGKPTGFWAHEDF